MILNSFGALNAGAIFGFLGIILGAFGSHWLEGRLDPEGLDAFETAVRYQIYHALLLVALGLSSLDVPRSLTLTFVVGVVLFSGSIYGLVYMDWSWLGPVTPIGGTLLIVGWTWLAVWSYVSV